MLGGYKAVVIGSERKAEIFRHLLEDSQDFQFRGFYDPDDPSNSDVFGKLLYTLELCEMGDVFFIDRHVRHLDQGLLETLVRMGKHILLDGFLLKDPDVAESLLNLSHEAGNCVHISNVLHNKPLFTTAAQYVRKPRFMRIEKNCNAPKPGEFGEWFYQNLSQELDIVIRLADSGIRNIAARPLFLFGNSPDLLNIHIEFNNDAICHITAGRAVEIGVHKLRVFQQDKLFHLDFFENRLLELRPANDSDQLSILPVDDEHGHREFHEIARPVMPFDSWKMEIRNFSENIHKKLSPLTNLEDMCALNSATQWILDRVQRRYSKV